MTLETVLQTVGGALLTVCLGLAGWALKCVVDLRERLSVNEAKDEQRHAEVERRFAELREEDQRLRQETHRLRKEQAAMEHKLTEAIRELREKVQKVHEDVLVLRAQGEE